MNYNNIPKDFFKRSIEILSQYENIKSDLGDDYHDVTLTINCFFGIIILPKANWYDELGLYTLNIDANDGIKIERKIGVTSNEVNSINLKEILHCLRNGIAHWLEKNNKNIKFEGEEHKQINKVTITGEGNVNGSLLTVKVEFDLTKNGFINFINKINTEIQKLK